MARAKTMGRAMVYSSHMATPYESAAQVGQSKWRAMMVLRWRKDARQRAKQSKGPRLFSVTKSA